LELPSVGLFVGDHQIQRDSQLDGPLTGTAFHAAIAVPASFGIGNKRVISFLRTEKDILAAYLGAFSAFDTIFFFDKGRHIKLLILNFLPAG
jgi:hypothetical protein